MSQVFLIVDFINHPLFVKLQNGHHITLIYDKKNFFKKGSIDDDVLYDDDDGHKDNYNDNPAHYDDNDNFVINIIIITNDDDDVDGVVYDVDDHDENAILLFMTEKKH